jgi:3-methyladenine DNA glycosylase AlkD
MARYGITAKQVLGVSIPNLRKMAKEIGTDHDLARQLWALESRETRILASMIADPKMVTEEQMESWATDFDSWEVCDQCCSNLFAKTRFAYQKAVEWSAREEEFIKRAGFVLIARLAVGDKAASDAQFEGFFLLIRREATDDRNYVRKAVIWALRQIGKRNLALNERALKTAVEIQTMGARNARWIASDAIRELTSEAVQGRLQARKG